MTTQHIVVLVGADVDPSGPLHAGGSLPLDNRDGAAVTVIATRAPTGDAPYSVHTVTAGTSPVDKISRALGLAVIARILLGAPLGRLLNSLNPLDRSRVFYRAIRRDPEARKLIASATLLVAVDLPAVRTAWVAGHSGVVPRAVFTLAAARHILDGS